MQGAQKSTTYFYPRPPRGGRRRLLPGKQPPSGFLSTPSARRATASWKLYLLTGKISIHALREEGDRKNLAHVHDVIVFLSTPSARRATFSARRAGRYWMHFYPRPPRGGRLWAQDAANRLLAISIHALREEGDRERTSQQTAGESEFLSTPSARRATQAGGIRPPRCSISIHALREEGDYGASFKMIYTAKFLSTPSARRATRPGLPASGHSTNFYPRPPRGGRPVRS